MTAEARRALMMAVKQSDFTQATVGDRTPWRECMAIFGCTANEPNQAEALGRPCDRRVGELTDAWTFEADPARRQDTLKHFEKTHLEIGTLIPLGQYRGVIAHRRSLRGELPGPALFYWNVEKV
jgi:hypothetical protein